MALINRTTLVLTCRWPSVP